MKKTSQKVAYLSRNSVVSEISLSLPNSLPKAQMAEFVFQDVAYRATVHRTGGFVYDFVWSQYCIKAALL